MFIYIKAIVIGPIFLHYYIYFLKDLKSFFLFFIDWNGIWNSRIIKIGIIKERVKIDNKC